MLEVEIPNQIQTKEPEVVVPKAKRGRPRKPIEETVKYKRKQAILARRQKAIDDETYKWIVKFKDIKLGEYAEKQCKHCNCVTKVKKKDTRGRKKKTQEERDRMTDEEKKELSIRMSILGLKGRLKQLQKL